MERREPKSDEHSGRAGGEAIARPLMGLGRGLSRFGQSHPIVSLVLVIVAMTIASGIFRGSERTARDIKLVAANLQRFFSIAPTLHHSLHLIEEGREGFRNPTILYPDRLVGLIIKAHDEKLDILASFDALDRAWREECPNCLLTIRFVYPAAVDSSIRRREYSWTDSSETIDRGNFGRMLPMLADIRDLIVETEGDRSGRGPLFQTGYPAEPTETARASAGARSTHSLGVPPGSP